MPKSSSIGATRSISSTSLSMNRKPLVSAQLPNNPPMRKSCDKKEKVSPRKASSSGPVMKQNG